MTEQRPIWQDGGIRRTNEREEETTMTEQPTTTIIAGNTWNLDDLVKFITETGRADVEQDNFGNIVIYVDAHEDENGNLCDGWTGEED